MTNQHLSLLSAILLLLSAAFAVAEKPRLRVGYAQKPEEARAELDAIRESAPDLESWKKRRAQVRAGILAGAKLEKLPKRTPLNPRFVSKRTRSGYVAENVAIESSPGHYVTGTLYRPTNFKGKLAGILCPHGHWNEARFFDCGEEVAKKLVNQGAEADLESARNHIQSRCVGLARLGVGFADDGRVHNGRMFQ